MERREQKNKKECESKGLRGRGWKGLVWKEAEIEMRVGCLGQ